MTLLPNQAPPLLMLVGAAGSGKDTIGDYLKRRHGFARLAFADPLHQAVRTLYGVSPAECIGGKETPIARLGDRSPRELLQELGDYVRREVGPQILIGRLVERAIERGVWKNAPLVITDARTDAEIEWGRAVGVTLVWVERPAAPEVRPHATERVAGLRVKHFNQATDYHVVNDGTPEQLFERVDAVLESLGMVVTP